MLKYLIIFIIWCRVQKPPTLIPTDCFVLRTITILPNIRISWDYHIGIILLCKTLFINKKILTQFLYWILFILWQRFFGWQSRFSGIFWRCGLFLCNNKQIPINIRIGKCKFYLSIHFSTKYLHSMLCSIHLFCYFFRFIRDKFASDLYKRKTIFW